MTLTRTTIAARPSERVIPGLSSRRPLWWLEPGWLIDRQLGPGAEANFYRSIVAGDLAVEILTPADWRRVAELVDTYGDLRLGGVDASLATVAERLGVAEVGTLDLRPFRVVRPPAHRCLRLSQ